MSRMQDEFRAEANKHNEDVAKLRAQLDLFHVENSSLRQAVEAIQSDPQLSAEVAKSPVHAVVKYSMRLADSNEGYDVHRCIRRPFYWGKGL